MNRSASWASQFLALLLAQALLAGPVQSQLVQEPGSQHAVPVQDVDFSARELSAPVDIKEKLEVLRNEKAVRGWTFDIKYTVPMERDIRELTGLKLPRNLAKKIERQNVKAAQKLADLKSEGFEIELTKVIPGALPSSFDWRQSDGVTGVRDQGACGSCWAFAAMGAYEGGYRIRTSKSVDVSEQDILSCSGAGSCSGGWWDPVFKYMIDHRVANEADYPYTASDTSCQTGMAKQYLVSTWGYVGSSKNMVPSVTELKQALMKYGPLSVAVNATSAFIAYGGGVFNENASGNINHGVTLIGWDDSTGAWLIKNSWGTGWGVTGGYGSERGYMWISYGSNKIGYAATWVIVATPWTAAGYRGKRWYVGDFNGDGKDDLMRVLNKYGGGEVLLSTGSGFGGAQRWTGAGYRGKGWYVGDFNGDGKDDLMRVLNRHGGSEVLLSTGSAFGGVQQWTGAGYRGKGWYIGDFNGDGKDDLMRVVNRHGGGEVLLSTGSAFGGVQQWTGAGYRGKGWDIGDFDGDGKDDLMRVVNRHGGGEVLLSTGSAFGSVQQWTGAGYRGKGWYVGDFNGDGKDDLMRVLTKYGGGEVLLSTGDGFGSVQQWTGAGYRGKGWYVGDFNGDGKKDIMRVLTKHGGGEVLLSTGSSFTFKVN